MIYHRFPFNFHEFLRVKTSINFILGCKKHISSNPYRLLYIYISLCDPILIECVQSQWSGIGGGQIEKTGGICLDVVNENVCSGSMYESTFEDMSTTTLG